MIPVAIISTKQTEKALPLQCEAWSKVWPGWVQYLRPCVYSSTPQPGEMFLPHYRWKTLDNPSFGYAIRWISESVASPFLLLMDDYIPMEVHASALIEAYGLACANRGIKQLRLLPCPGGTRLAKNIPLSYIHEIDPSAAYSLSFQAALWSGMFLREFVKEKDSPWAAEIEGSKRYARSILEYRSCAYDVNVLSYENLYRHGKLQEAALLNCINRGLTWDG